MPPDDLDRRLAALEERAPAPSQRPGDWRRQAARRPRLASPALLAAGLTLVLSVGVVAGSAVLEGLQAKPYPGVQNPGQPLQGARLECMSPPAAERLLARRGFHKVVWQVESGSGKSARSVQQRSAPQHGYVVPGAIVGGVLHMVVDQRDGASGTGACPAMKMP